jgi:hypothetical protein
VLHRHIGKIVGRLNAVVRRFQKQIGKAAYRGSHRHSPNSAVADNHPRRTGETLSHATVATSSSGTAAPPNSG